MDHSYAERRQAEKNTAEKEAAEQQPSLAALRSGAAQPTPGQRGRQVDLPDAMRSKMENVFGADLSAVKLYESQTVADVGSQAITQGADIAFAPGLLDFSSFSGQALLGHELSHVVSQARGEVTGGGFLNDASLEARADREGAMAAAGQTVVPPTASLSPVSAADAAGPMQAKIKPEEQSTGDTAAAQPAAAQSPPPPAHLPDAALQIPPPPARLPDAALQPFIPIPASLAPAPAAAVQAPVPAPAADFGFAASPSASVSAGGARFLLGEQNANSFRHGKQFRQMMTSLGALDDVKRSGAGDAAKEAMLANANQQAIADMKAYRKKLKGERIDKGGRTAQIAALKTMIHAAKADQQAVAARQTTTLEGSEFEHDIRGGGLNQVYRYQRGGKNAFFKPHTSDTPTSTAEKELLEESGVSSGTSANGAASGLRLAEREIAYARLGSLLGSDVALGSKKATLGDQTPTGTTEGPANHQKTFTAREGDTGALTEEATGKDWRAFNWQFSALKEPAPGSPEEVKARDALPHWKMKPISTMDWALSGYRVHGFGEYSSSDPRLEAYPDVGTRAALKGLTLRQTDTVAEPAFAKARAANANDYADQGPLLDFADPNYQRQMNEMFLMDTLAGHFDRHFGNFLVDRGENGKAQVKAIDNDATFGDYGTDPATGKDLNAVRFGKNKKRLNYGNLPAHMQIDANMAQKIRGVTRKQLELTFSDLLSEGEINALATRFEMMRKYIDAMEKEDPSLIVSQWNEETSKREGMLGSGTGAARRADETKAGGYLGNNYYQRQFMWLNNQLDK